MSYISFLISLVNSNILYNLSPLFCFTTVLVTFGLFTNGSFDFFDLSHFSYYGPFRFINFCLLDCEKSRPTRSRTFINDYIHILLVFLLCYLLFISINCLIYYYLLLNSALIAYNYNIARNFLIIRLELRSKIRHVFRLIIITFEARELPQGNIEVIICVQKLYYVPFLLAMDFFSFSYCSFYFKQSDVLSVLG